MANYSEIGIALAGVCQVANLVQKFAHQGYADNQSVESSLKSLLVLQPESTLAVFGDTLSHIKLGLETALSQLGGGNGQLDAEIGRYWIGILSLSRKLDQNPQAKAKLAQRLQQLERQLALYDGNILHEQMITNMAAIYSDIISPLGSRIQVLGRQDQLARPEIQNRIRAILLAGIRAGILWQQVGGSRWQFFFSRRKILAAIRSLHSTL